MNKHVVASRGRAARLVIAGAALGLLAACSNFGNQEKVFEEDLPEYRADLPDADWTVIATRLPAVPDPKKLVKVDPEMVQTSFTYGVDPDSLRIDPGRIVRYTLVSQSDMGATNISYEAMRCGMRQVRNIAIARPGEGWQRAYNDAWRPIEAVNRTAVQNVLFKGVLCAGGGPASMSLDVLRKRLTYWRQHAYGVEARDNQ
ncbi:hypothetical protein FXN63_03920 [Pigmentiphaga aceris]|uniref:CNP1-like uncharacterized domain-containing protein n=1 Tax=Pigmentiphaga aceris TaxID=1940612 RepID=A0A5C0ASB7_9BURK|nr:CNP1-like family protein [Pigmentiphaga aceris]QEI05078.1 hypothetical protein FXN63_03920 [Pigmentiphaga aceris]